MVREGKDKRFYVKERRVLKAIKSLDGVSPVLKAEGA